MLNVIRANSIICSNNNLKKSEQEDKNEAFNS